MAEIPTTFKLCRAWGNGLLIAAVLLFAGCSGSITQPPANKVIHVCDWHYVPKELFAADLRSTPGQRYSDKEIDKLYAAHLNDVEAVQKEQVEFLRELIRQHQLFHVWVEGLTPKKLPGFLDLVDQTKAVEQDQIPQLKRQLKEVEQLLAGMESEGRLEAPEYQQSKAIQAKVQGLLNEQRERMLQIGAAGTLMMTGELKDVVPLDDDVTLAAAHPLRQDGTVQLDPESNSAREAAQVKRIITADDPVSVIVLGAAHDLTAHFTGSSTEYERMKTQSVPDGATE